MLEQIQQYIKCCGPCQKAKRGLRGMGKLPMKDVETEPWKDVAVDLSGPWTATIDKKKVEFHTFTIIDMHSFNNGISPWVLDGNWFRLNMPHQTCRMKTCAIKFSACIKDDSAWSGVSTEPFLNKEVINNFTLLCNDWNYLRPTGKYINEWVNCQ